VLTKGDTVGRYVIVGRIGAGGMGVVYRADDPELGRPVALKLVRVDPRVRRPAWIDSKTPVDDSRERLLREAQAMAKLQHPNVIAVHDVGAHGNEVFVAMELVDGPSLAVWLDERRRGWREVCNVFAQAGRGLAAAHRAGLVHRDFKPDNVLVGRDGRARVADFGLSRALDLPPGGGAASAPAPLPFLAAPDGRLDSLTVTGSIVGTPGYMSPEQLVGRQADERSDQFSFCVALYVALTGSRPFRGTTFDEHSDAVQRGAFEEPPPGRMPRFVRRLLRRGLSPRPVDRFPSMDALLDELGGERRRKRWLAAAAACALALVVAGVVLLRRPAPAELCHGGAQRLDGVWDADRRAAVRAAFVGSGSAVADDALRALTARLDGYAHDWIAMHDDACAAAHVRGEQSSELYDLRMSCLAGRRDELRALVDVLAHADRGVVERAVVAGRGLPALDECADVRRLSEPVPLPRDPAQRAQAEGLRTRAAQVHALLLAGRVRDALALARALAPPAAALGYRPVQSAVLHELGDLQSRTGDAKTAEQTLVAAALAAQAGRDTRLAVLAYLDLGLVIAIEERQPERGLAQLKLAGALIEAMGGDGWLEGRLAGSEGQVLADSGRTAEAIGRLERALALFEKVRGPEDLDAANALNDLGGAYRVAGRYADALAAHRRALQIRETVLGPHHPFVASSLLNLGNVYHSQGQPAAAQPFYERALAIRERALGESPRVAEALVASAENLEALGRGEEALAQLGRALAIQEKTIGADHADTATTLVATGDALLALGRAEPALAAYRRALAIREQALGPEDADVAASCYAIAMALLELGHGAEAEPQLQRALAIDTKVSGADGAQLAFDLTGLGRTYLALGRAPAAIAPLERALALRTATRGDPVDLAATQMALARALWDAGADRARARELARSARAAYASAGSGKEKALAEVEAWLRAR
jgi:tetratricopeptide (TPR) repeat protein